MLEHSIGRDEGFRGSVGVPRRVLVCVINLSAYEKLHA